MRKHRKNLILISLDTLRADVAYSGRLPNLTRMAASGASFLNTVSSSPITPASHASVFTGLHPYEHGLRYLLREPLRTGKPTIAELLSDAGYGTGAIVSCPGLDRWYGLNRGFKHYDDGIPLLPDGRDPRSVVDVKIRGMAMKRAPLVVDRALSWLKLHKSAPFFLFAHFFDTHWPYEPPEWYAPADANPYEGEAHFVDHYLGVLLGQIEKWGLLDNSLLIIFSDHGEDLAGWYANDHAGPELGHPEENGHGALLFDATQMVPLVVIDRQAIQAPMQIETQVRLVDILPTIVDLLQISDGHARHGASLRECLEGSAGHRTAYCETYYRHEQSLQPGGIPGLGPWHGMRVDNRFKFIVDVESGAISFYDLTCDPNEQRPLQCPSAAAQSAAALFQKTGA